MLHDVDDGKLHIIAETNDGYWLHELQDVIRKARFDVRVLHRGGEIRLLIPLTPTANANDSEKLTGRSVFEPKERTPADTTPESPPPQQQDTAVADGSISFLRMDGKCAECSQVVGSLLMIHRPGALPGELHGVTLNDVHPSDRQRVAAWIASRPESAIQLEWEEPKQIPVPLSTVGVNVVS
jgi:hypothetical protein